MRAARLASLILFGALLTGCSGSNPAPEPGASSAPAPSSAPSPTASASPTAATPIPTPAASSITEPTTTNTLPPPPEPSRPAASTAGALSAGSLPVPAGWHTVARKGGVEEGFEGNGTWVHARDPRYAATDTITIGCAEVTRDDFPDPVSALEGNYENTSGDPGIGLVLQFRSADAAGRYFQVYRRQVEACTDPSGPVVISVLNSGAGLIDHRTYADDGQWTEAAKLTGSRLTLILLTDPGHKIDTAEAEAILAKIPA